LSKRLSVRQGNMKSLVMVSFFLKRGWGLRFVLHVQISRTKAESQQIVAQRPLSCVQYLVLYLSRLQRICLSRYLNLLFSLVCHQFDPVKQCQYNVMILRKSENLLIRTHDDILGKQYISPLSSMDSGLEAFSRNPTHGSFSALTFPSTECTKYVNQRFLSY
jgi:hypothetical protein